MTPSEAGGGRVKGAPRVARPSQERLVQALTLVSSGCPLGEQLLGLSASGAPAVEGQGGCRCGGRPLPALCPISKARVVF